MNKAIILGRLTADPQTGEINSGKAYAKFTVAVNRIGDGADFINVIAWERLAENVGKYLSKGRQVCVVGHIQTGSYERDGVKRNTFDIVAENVEFVGSSQSGGEANADARISDTPTLREVDDDDMPF